MSLVQDQCICLRRIEYSETSQILWMMSRQYGLQRLIAKGAHRKTKAGASKFGGGIDLLEVGDAVFTLRPDKDLSTLTEWNLRDGHLELRRSLRALYLAQYAAEMTSLLFEEHDPHPQVFDRLQQTLADLSTPRLEESFVSFELDLLREAGLQPTFDTCTSCGSALASPAPAYFSPTQGGLLCRNCEMSFPDRLALDPGLIGIVQGILRLPNRLPRLTRRQSDPINRMLAHHMQHTLGRELRLAQYVI